MADNNVNRFSREDAANANNMAQAARSLTEELKDQLGIRSRLNETQRETLNLTRQLQRSAQENTVEIGNSGNIERQISKDKKISLNLERELLNLKKLVSTEGSKQVNAAKLIQKFTSKIKDIENELEGLSGQALATKQYELSLAERDLRITLATASADAQRLALVEQSYELSRELIESRLKEANIQKQINDKMGVTGALVKGTGALMERLGMRSGIFQDAMKESAEAMREMAEETVRGEKSFTKLEIMLKGFSKLSAGFSKALFDPFTIATKLLDIFFRINKQSVEISRLTGQIGSGFNYLNTGASSAIDKMEVVAELTRQTGLNAQNAFSPSVIAGAADLKVEMGLAADEAGNLAVIAQTSNTSLEALTDTIVDTASAFNRSNRAAVSQGVILRDIGNVSEGIRASFAGNTQALVKGAAAARKLGMDIKRLNDIASSLLDFESSISSELEAQLLTGKNLNLAKARELALNNDLAGLGEELFKNSAKLVEFSNMNRIQQESYAKALGMSRDELARVAYQQALLSGMTSEQAAAAAKVNAEDMKRIDIQENFMKAIEKIAASLTPILDTIGNILSMPLAPYFLLGAGAAVKLGGSITSAATGMVSFGKGIFNAIKNFDILNAKQAIFGKMYKGGQFMPGGGRAAAGGQRAGGLFSTLFGKKGAAAIPPQAGESAGSGITGITNALSKVDMKKVLQGAAAMAVVAGAVFIFGKAVQQFTEVSWGDVGKAVVGMLALVGAVAAIGAIMMSGVGAVAILAGAAAMLIMASAVMVLGYGVQALATGFNMMVPNLITLAQLTPQLLGVGMALMSIAAGLGMIAVSGLAAIPALAALSGFALIATPLIALGGVFGDGGEDTDGFSKLEAKLDKLIEVISAGGDVYLDSDKVGRTQAKSFSSLTGS